MEEKENKSTFLINILEKYINKTVYHEEFGVYFIKELVSRIRNMKIEIYSNDHNPPHFHVKSSDKSINATFRLDNCNLLKGEIDIKDRKRIEAFFNDPETKYLMKEMWNKSKDENRKL
ncbi:DUF4160 domain-containing protein [Polaribacter sp. Asnod1-A03]|uniref:DUF4160 domain-containing protein n=1 Tax=Polaribacter sp. Asnod1-A03 TaxID=3160581 RepID=UPI003863B22B